MSAQRSECLDGLKLNIRLINSHMDNLLSYEVSKFYTELKEVLFFYGYNSKNIDAIIKYSGTYDEFSDEELLEMEGVTNAMLFHLKYKM